MSTKWSEKENNDVDNRPSGLRDPYFVIHRYCKFPDTYYALVPFNILKSDHFEQENDYITNIRSKICMV